MMHKPITSIPYQITTIQSGVRVLTVPMKNFESVGVAIWVGAGSRYEDESISGVSHFLEHMLFKGTPKRSSRQIRLDIEGVGGMLNAFTGEESTCYFTKMLLGHLKTGLEVLSDMVIHAKLTRKDMEKERKVILEEIKMYQDLPSHGVHEEIIRMLWPGHPLGRPISGTYESVSRITRNDMLRYKTEHYYDQNILVSVAGSVDHDKIVSWVQNMFLTRQPGKTRNYLKASRNQKSPEISLMTKKIEQTHFVMGIHTFSRFHPDRYKLALLNVILGANMSSRLFEVVREKRGLAYEIRSGTGFYQDAGYMAISAGVENTKAQKTIEVILLELKKIRTRGVTSSELRRAKEYFQSQLRMALEDTLDHLLWVGERVIDGNLLPDLRKIDAAIQQVTESDVRQVAERLFVSKNLNLALMGPEPEKDRAAIQKIFSLN
ncbi:MAG: insulinase family protein [Candidatus Omnitrophica bacterium]|nr:insulinase family protein [Candidatus Omnitrophota bacterium]